MMTLLRAGFALALLAVTAHAVEPFAPSLVSPADAATPIGAIADDGEGYDGQAVAVVGTAVLPAYGYAGESVYTLTQDERRITVVSKQAPPPLGALVSVDATVRWREGDEEFTWPPILVESSRSIALRRPATVAEVAAGLARASGRAVSNDPVDSDLGAVANGGGCYPTGIQVSLLDMLILINPEWAPVVDGHTVDSPPVTIHGTVQEMHGDTSGDFPSTHARADVVHVLDLDDADRFRLGTGNDGGGNDFQTEWEAGLYPAWAWAGAGDRMVAIGRWIFDCGHPGGAPGNCSATTARACVVDTDCRPPTCPGCGSAEQCLNEHFGYSTELHPPYATAAIRQGRGGIVSDLPNAAAVRATRVDVYASPGAGGAGDRCVLTHRASELDQLTVQCWPVDEPVAQLNAEDFRFDIPLPPRPRGSRLSWRIIDRSQPGDVPARLRIKRRLHGDAPFLAARLRLHRKVRGVLPTGFAATIEAGWLGDPTPLTHVRVTFTGVDVHNALQPVTPSVPRTCSVSDTPCDTEADCPSGESCFGAGPVKSWRGQVAVNGEWTELTGLDDVDSGASFPQAIVVDQYLPDDGSLHVEAVTRAHECINTMYAKSLAEGLVELGFNKGVICLATEARDPGAIDVTYGAPDFGSGGGSMDHETVSVGGRGGHCSATTAQLCTLDADCPSSETCIETGGAYSLRYRIEKLP